MSTEPGRSGITSALCYYLCVFEIRSVSESVPTAVKNTGTKEAAEKRLFCALRFATRKPAAARRYVFSATYGTTESRALIQGFTHENFFRNL